MRESRFCLLLLLAVTTLPSEYADFPSSLIVSRSGSAKRTVGSNLLGVFSEEGLGLNIGKGFSYIVAFVMIGVEYDDLVYGILLEV